MKMSSKKSKKGFRKKITLKKGFNIFLEILLFAFILLLAYSILSTILTPKEALEIPENVLNAYATKGVNSMDTLTPLIIKLLVIIVCLTITFLVVWNKRKIVKGFEKAISPHKKRADNLKIRQPTIKEGIIAIFAFLFWYLFNDAVNNHAGSPLGIYEIGVFFGNLGVPIIEFIWVGFFGSFFLMMVLIMRSQWKRTGTTPKYDPFMGLFAMIGYIFMLIATVAQLTGIESTSTLLWFGGIAKSTVYHLGVIMLVISLLYYVITE